MIDHVFNLTFLEFFVLKVHDSVSNEQSHQLDLLGFWGRGAEVMVVNFEGQVRYVLPSIGLTGDPEVVLRVLGIVGEEVS